MGLLVLIGAATCGPAQDTMEARPFVHPLFGDHMVLQHGRPNTIWGWSEPGAVVRVTFGGQCGRGVADAAGRWAATITPRACDSGGTLCVDGPQHCAYRDVLVGQVWVSVGPRVAQAPRAGIGPTGAAGQIRVRIFQGDELAQTAGNWRRWPEAAAEGTNRVCGPAQLLVVAAHLETREPVGLVIDETAQLAVEEWIGAQKGSGEPE